MKLKVKLLDISSSWNVCIIHKTDAKKLDIHSSGRLSIRHNDMIDIDVIDVAHGTSIIGPGEIAIFKESFQKLNLKEDDIVNVNVADKPESISIIKQKWQGKAFSYSDFDTIINDILNNNLSDIEFTYFVTACAAKPLSNSEIVKFTKSMVNNGEKLKFKNKVVADKHCVGGVAGNRTSMIVIPILAAEGITIPKTSSRAITSPAGTSDTMECLANVNLESNALLDCIDKNDGALVWGGAMNLAPVDDKIIRIEHPLKIDIPGILLSSILAKKYSVSATHVLIDIPYGRGSKFESKSSAIRLKKKFESLSKNLSMKLKVILTDGTQPIGNGIGPYLESLDVIAVLENKKSAPLDLREKSLIMAGELFELTGHCKSKEGYKLAKSILESGRALKKMNDIIKFQGKAKKIKSAKYTKDVYSNKSGVISSINNRYISRCALLLGCPKTKTAGIYIHKKVGAKVTKKTKVITLYAESKQKLNQVEFLLDKLYTVEKAPN